MLLGLKTDIGSGNREKGNEDNLIALNLYIDKGPNCGEYHILLLADGMGGLDKGEMASALTIRGITKHLINRLVTEKGIFPSPEEPVEPGALLKEAIEMGSSGKALFRFEGDEKIKANTDPEMLKDALANLARNSAMRSREAVWIELKAKKEGNSIIISYADNAPEIPFEQREKLFSPLNGGNNSEMNLSVVSMVINELGGKIQIDQNTNGSGAKFAIELPSAKE